MDLIDKEFIESGKLFELMLELGTIQEKEIRRESELQDESIEYEKKHRW